MPYAKLKFGKPYRNIDERSITENLYVGQDIVFTEANTIMKRPGLVQFADVGTGIACDGIYWWDKMDMAIVISNGRVWKITDSSGTMTELTTTGSTPNVGYKVSFAEVYYGSTLLLFFVNKGVIMYTDGGATYETHPDGTAPQAASHLVHLNGVLVANDTGVGQKNTFYWSAASDPLDFNGVTAGDAQAEMAVDDIFAIHEVGKKLWVVGKSSIEPWVFTGDTISEFRPVQGSFVNIGSYTPDSGTIVDGSFAVLTDKRDVRVFSGDNPKSNKTISQPYNSRIQAFTNIESCQATNISSVGGRSYLKFDFAGENTSLVYDYILDAWYEWGLWDSNQYNQFLGSHYCYARKWGLHLICSRLDGKLYSISTSTYKDDTYSIRSKIQTGWYDHGDPRMKAHDRLYLDLRRGDGTVDDPNAPSYISLRWRDNKRADWGNAVSVSLSLGSSGDHDNQMPKLAPMGAASNRQYEIVHGGNSQFVLNGMYDAYRTIE